MKHTAIETTQFPPQDDVGVDLMDETVLHYRILNKIGEGGMGVVYKALDTRLDRPVAIKTLPASSDSNRRRQFVWEARAAAGLRHPNIVVIHEIAADRGLDFIVMEYIPGTPLSETLASGPITADLTVQYAQQIASALEAAHNAGIVHRDLKPSNILVTPEGSIKVVDFGLARLQRQDADSQNEAPAAAGTCGYMSPEQAHGENATPQSDIFSLGAVLYEMVTGQRAFKGQSAVAVTAALLRDDPPAIAPLAPECPPALERIVVQCLRKDPHRRFQHMGDVRLALEEVRPAGRGRRRGVPAVWRRGLVPVSLMALLLVSAWLVFSRYSETEANSMPIPLTSFPGIETAAAWSPDGSRVAFNWNGEKEDNEDIYVIQPGSSQRLRLTTDPGIDDKPAWSPDGQWIAYTHVTKDRYSLNLVSPLGGPQRTFLTSATVLNVANWTPDGRAVLVDTAPAPHQPEAVWAIFLFSGKRLQLTWPPQGIPGDLAPAMSPSGKTLAFVRKTAWRTSELYLQDLKPDLSLAGTPRRVTDLGYVARPAWAPDGHRIVFEAHRDGVGIWQVESDGTLLRPVLGAPDTASLPTLARRPGGQTSLVFTNGLARSSIWRYSTDRGPGGTPAEVAPSTRSQSSPHFSDDGKRLAFTSHRTGYPEIWAANGDGSEPVQLTNLRHQLSEAAHWSPDGDRVAFVSQDHGSRQIYLVGSSGGPAVPITSEPGVDIGSGWTRDSKGYYYDSMQSGHRQVRKAFRDGGRPELMTASGGWGGFESQSGIFYYWQDSKEGAVLNRRTSMGDERAALIPNLCGACGIASSPEGFYYAAYGRPKEVYEYVEKTGRSVKVIQLPPSPVNQFTLSPDGRWFVSSDLGAVNIDLMIIENFH